MSTRSNIAIEGADGSIKVIYCHFDGYLEHVGKILHENYKTTVLVDTLVSGGDMSALGKTPGECEYYKDREGEKWEDVKPQQYDTTKEYFDTLVDDVFIEYIYIFDINTKEWRVSYCRQPFNQYRLKSELEKESIIEVEQNMHHNLEYTLKIHVQKPVDVDDVVISGFRSLRAADAAFHETKKDLIEKGFIVTGVGSYQRDMETETELTLRAEYDSSHRTKIDEVLIPTTKSRKITNP